VLAENKEPVGRATGLRVLSSGKIILQDNLRRRVVLLDTTLSTVHVLLDSVGTPETQYPRTTIALLPWRGDSTLIVDVRELALFTADSAGAFGRTMAVPTSTYASNLVAGVDGVPEFDASGRLVFRGPRAGSYSGGDADRSHPDSAPLLRVDLLTRRVD